ncbi:hypothetical protein [Mucilaginibacter agri]|uniref:O-Glycosyl hydrolase n=1 Tax=Mucilaginibacter agri TaxID=2695265 RepID=A0A965ZHX2_9SPHI|nr:hypothetical protein [Mucilaginibacter agri]NCD70022.1 hypothetical protein [Mucilaginibacter agri]
MINHIKFNTFRFMRHALLATAIIALAQTANAQAELQPWGNLTGIRKSGQLFEFESAISVVWKSEKNATETRKEEQQPKYTRAGKSQIVNTAIDSLILSETVTEAGNGKANINLTVTAKKDEAIQGVYFKLKLPASYSTMSVNGASPSPLSALNSTAKEVLFSAGNQQIKLSLDEPTSIIIEKSDNSFALLVPVQTGNMTTGQTASHELTLTVDGEINRNPVNIQLDAANQGRIFEGFGGNFRLQNPKTDPQVIDYCLDNMRVAWGRVEMPFAQWQPDENSDPLKQDPNTTLNPHVKASMEMAQRLQKIGMPIILTSWNAPKWAIIGEPKSRPKPGEQWGNPLNYQNIQTTYKSIADYIVYLKSNFGVDVTLFSFNESDLGINIRVTGKEHNELIKGLGAYFVSRGLKTKMLLGDNSDATTYEFIYPALNDPDAKQYIGAVSFHSWRGWDTPTLQKWADAAKKIDMPLIVGEGSIDAAAWNYPDIFQEQVYAIEEINLYMRLLSICQPVSILQWQLTADYSPLIGGGIFGNNEPLHPGQRFWNLKQLASTPKNVYAIGSKADAPNITCAALANKQTPDVAVHLVNNGPKRDIVVSGIPATGKKLVLYITSKKLSMKKKSNIKIVNGKASFTVPEVCFASLITE